MKKLIVSAVVLPLALSACTSTSINQKMDEKTGIKVTTVAVAGCGVPSQTMTWVDRPGKVEESYASTGSDICTSVGTGAAASAVLPRSEGIQNTVVSGSSSNAQQTMDLNL